MPNTSSAKKAHRQAKTRTAQNLQRKVRLKRALKTVNADSVASTVSLVDKAVKQQLIHKNKAARLKKKIAKNVGLAKAKRPGAGQAPVKKTAAKNKPEQKNPVKSGLFFD